MIENVEPLPNTSTFKWGGDLFSMVSELFKQGHRFKASELQLSLVLLVPKLAANWACDTPIDAPQFNLQSWAGSYMWGEG